MPWDQLHLELGEMFCEYTDREYDRQKALESYVAWDRSQALCRMNEWRRRNPDEHRARTREAMRRYRARRKDDPAYRAHRAELERKRYARAKAAQARAA